MVRPEHAFQESAFSASFTGFGTRRDKIIGVTVALAAHLLAIALLIVSLHAPKAASIVSLTAPIQVVMDRTVPPPMETPFAPVMTRAPQASAAPPVFAILPAASDMASASNTAAGAGTAGTAAAAGSHPGDAGMVGSDYLERLHRHLMQFYNDRPYITGTVSLHFRIDRAGHVLLDEVAKSSGSRELDSYAVALMHRADPLPPVPAELRGDVLDLTVPVTMVTHDDGSAACIKTLWHDDGTRYELRNECSYPIMLRYCATSSGGTAPVCPNVQEKELKPEHAVLGAATVSGLHLIFASCQAPSEPADLVYDDHIFTDYHCKS